MTVWYFKLNIKYVQWDEEGCKFLYIRKFRLWGHKKYIFVVCFIIRIHFHCFTLKFDGFWGIIVVIYLSLKFTEQSLAERLQGYEGNSARFSVPDWCKYLYFISLCFENTNNHDAYRYFKCTLIYLENSLFSFALKLCVCKNLAWKKRNHLLTPKCYYWYSWDCCFITCTWSRKIASLILYFFRSPHPFPWWITPWIVWLQSLLEHQPINSDALYSVWL